MSIIPPASEGERPDAANLTFDQARAVIVKMGEPREVLPITSGRVTVEGEQSPRRIADVTVFGEPYWVPTKPYDPLDARSETELRVEIGGTDRDGHTWWVPQGLFQVRRPRVRRQPDGTTIDVSAVDRSSARRWPLLGGVAVASGTSMEDAIKQVLSVGNTPVVLDAPLATTGIFLPSSILGKAGDDPWSVCHELARSMGWNLAYDRRGIVRLAQIPDPTTVPPVQTYQITEADTPWSPLMDHLEAGEGVYSDRVTIRSLSPLAGIERSIDGDDMIDGVALIYNGETIVRPDAFVRFPAYWSGDTSLLLTRAMAVAALDAEVARRRGQVEQVSFTAVVDPFREVDEVVTVIDPESGVNLTGRIAGLGYVLGSPMMEVRLANWRFA